jgi:hypothetical protein
MRKQLWATLLVILFLASSAFGTTVSGTFLDSNSLPLSSATYVISLSPGPQSNLASGESTTTVTGTLSAAGAFTGVTLGDVQTIGGGATWKLVITSQSGQVFGAYIEPTGVTYSASTTFTTALGGGAIVNGYPVLSGNVLTIGSTNIPGSAGPMMNGLATSYASPVLAIYGASNQSSNVFTVTNYLNTATPATIHGTFSQQTLGYAGSVTIGGGGGNVTGVRGLITVATGTTLAAGYAYGTQGKVVINGTLTTQSGGGMVAGVFGQFDLTGATLTNAGLTAPGIFDMGSAGTNATIANLHGIVISNTTNVVAGSAIHIATTSSAFSNILSLNDPNHGSWKACTTSFTTPSAGLYVLIGSTQYVVPVYAACT